MFIGISAIIAITTAGTAVTGTTTMTAGMIGATADATGGIATITRDRKGPATGPFDVS